LAAPSTLKIIAGWVGAGVAFPIVLGFIFPGLAGLSLLYLLTGALLILIGPVAHVLMARSAVESGTYNAPRTVAKVAAGIFATVLILALLGVFNFA
jgi:hypothetical protein